MSTIAETRQKSLSGLTGLQPVRVVAEFLSLSRSKVYQLMENGELSYVKLGKSRRVQWSDVLKLVEQNTITRAH